MKFTDFGDSRRYSATRLALAGSWLLVSIPLAWGVYETVVKSLALFR
jgi:hypothetical protein